MDKIYEKANDQHVRNYIVYGNITDHKLYAESDHKTPIEQKHLEEMFKKGAILIYDGTSYLVPIELANNKIKTMGISEQNVAFVEWEATASE